LYTFRTKNTEKIGRKRNFLLFVFILTLFILTTPLKSTAIFDVSADANQTEYTVTYNSVSDPTSGSYFTKNAGPFPDNKQIRVAIYDEDNSTSPSYTTHQGNVHNNVSGMVDILSMVDTITPVPLTTFQISEHALTTASFDVLILIDNHPRESIITDILDFWLAGGGILTLDGSAIFLNYFGVLPPESIGDDGWGTYWNYVYNDLVVTTRHPITKGYSLATEVDLGLDYLCWDWTALQTSIINSDLTMVASSPTDSNAVTVLAFDPSDRGGKIATIAWDLVSDNLPELYPMIHDACDWLAPRPKAKIAFDISHSPRLGIDPWDDESTYPNFYYGVRDYLVSLGFTVDKLYAPLSGDALTVPRLEQYDMLILITNDVDYTADERIAVEAWVGNGGSLLAMGDNHLASFILPNERLNALLAPFDVSIWEAYGVGAVRELANYHKQPLTANCDGNLTVPYYGYVNYTGDAFPIWQDGPEANFVAAGQEYGEGRLIVMSDINWLQSDGGYLDLTANKNYICNVAEWLTAATAKVLVYLDFSFSSTFYKAPMALALNDLGVKYYLNTPSYSWGYYEQLNMSLRAQDWDLIIINNPSLGGIIGIFDELLDYLDTGGHLILSTYDADNYAPHPLFYRMGFNVTQNVMDQPPLYIWDTGHDIFNQPIAYGEDRFEAILLAADDGDRLEVYSNATALAGYTTTETAGEAFIVLRNDEQTLYNGYLIDIFNEDLDDSCYLDNFELWKNEIAFMLRPKLEFTPNFDVKVKKGDVLIASLDITNNGFSAASAGLVEFILPAELGTTVDPMEVPFTVAVGGTTTRSWTIDITGTGTHTLTFDAIYQGFIGTVYGTFSVIIDVNSGINLFSPPALWYLIGIGAGVIALIIIITIVTVVLKKKKISTR